MLEVEFLASDFPLQPLRDGRTRGFCFCRFAARRDERDNIRQAISRSVCTTVLAVEFILSTQNLSRRPSDEVG